MKKKNTNYAAIFLMGIMSVCLLIICGRFMYIQATGEANGVSLTDWADDIRETSIALESERGIIYDHDGMILAYNRPTYRVYAILDEAYSLNQPKQKHVSDFKKTAKQLATHLDMEPNEINEVLKKGAEEERFQVEFGAKGKDLSREVKEEIEALDLPGIYFMENDERYYPNGIFASHIIGFAKNDATDGETYGVTGIEKQKDSILSGEDGYLRYQRDKYNKKLLNAEEVVQEPKNGDHIYLTIDQKVQVLLEDLLSQVDEKYEPEKITAIVMSAKTGQIVAMGNRPSYNPNDTGEIENWYNDAISSPIEPGSTFKMFTWASAIDSGNYNGGEMFQSGSYQINPSVSPVKDHNQGKGWGKISYDEGFRRSSNVAASKLVWEKMGGDVFYDYLQSFQFDQKTDIDLPSEQIGSITYNYPSDKIRTGFGQSSTVTPIQLMKAASAITNEGEMLQPYVIDKIIDTDSKEIVEENKPKVVGKPISKATAEKMVDLLDSVVNSKDGTGRKYQLDDYTLIGKTGTAQISNPNGGGYLTGRENNLYSFLGMAPKNDPELIVYVSVSRPNLGLTESGSDAVSLIFKNVMNNGLRYLNIEPDKEQTLTTPKKIDIPEIIDQNTEKIRKQLTENKLTVKVIGDGNKVVDANVSQGDGVYAGQQILLLTDQPTMPNLKGWSKREVLSLAEMLDLKVNTKGSGFVVKQSIKPDAKVKDAQTLEVTFEDPYKKKKKK